MHRTLKSVLAALSGTPAAVAQAPSTLPGHHEPGRPHLCFSFFSRHPPRLVSDSLPSVDGETDELAKVHALVRETHQKMSRRYRDIANRARKTQKVEVGVLVWVRS